MVTVCLNGHGSICTEAWPNPHPTPPSYSWGFSSMTAEDVRVPMRGWSSPEIGAAAAVHLDQREGMKKPEGHLQRQGDQIPP